jgi:hypothetical protein
VSARWPDNVAARAASRVRQAAVQLFYQVLDSDVPPKLAAIGIVVLVDAQMSAEPIKHLDDQGLPAVQSAG